MLRKRGSTSLWDSRDCIEYESLLTNVPRHDKAYMPGGFTSDGTSLDVVLVANRALNAITDMYQWMEAHIEIVVQELERRRSRPAELRFNVGDLESFVQGRLSLIEQSSGVTFYPEGEDVRCG